jgi:serine/threonine-protein kinase
MATAICAEANRTVRRRPARNAPALPPKQIGSWIVERELGRGGMASVHAVVHKKLGGRAAIKLAHDGMFTDTYTPETFLREARVARTVEHAGVVEVYSTGTWEGRPYIVMERIDGESLGNRIDRGPMDRTRAYEILMELCRVLGAAHAAGIVHRDLKLDNVIVGEQVRLVDWGVAHVAGEDDPFCGLIAGTLVYVAPELIRGEDVTPAADIYSLAVLAYHLLCRRPPFASSSDLALISMHLRTDPPRASCAWPEIPEQLDDLLFAMLDKAPEARPTLGEVERVLGQVMAAGATPRPRPKRSWIGIGVAVATAAAALAGLF